MAQIKFNMWRLVDILIVICFSYFIIVQFNDPDGWLWIIFYLIPILFATLSFAGKSNPKWSKLALIVFIFLTGLNSPSFIEWLKLGKPDFMDYKPTDISIAEAMRELLGLVITTFAIGILHVQAIRDKKNP